MRGARRWTDVVSLLMDDRALGYDDGMEQKRDLGRKSGVINALAMERPEDSQKLILRLQEGSREALERLMDLHGEDLMRYLIGLTGDRESAEDVFQDAWVRVMDKARSIHPSGAFAPWLFRIARNRAIDLMRRNAFRKTHSLEEASLASRARPEEPDFLDKERVRKMMARLPVKHREILGLRFFLDKSYEEISLLLRIPLGTVKSRLKRALDQMARALREESVHE